MPKTADINKDNLVRDFDDSGWDEPQKINDEQDYEGEI